ncbi:hypothetical protein D3C86_2161430 [compost metagenome]
MAVPKAVLVQNTPMAVDRRLLGKRSAIIDIAVGAAADSEAPTASRAITSAG